MNHLLSLLIQVFAVILAADFVAGIVHWIEDAYIREDTPLVGSTLGRTNTLHHHLPRHMTQKNWWQSNWDLLLAMGLLVLAAALLGCLTWHVWLFAIVAGNANEVHKWSHRTRMRMAGSSPGCKRCAFSRLRIITRSITRIRRTCITVRSPML